MKKYLIILMFFSLLFSDIKEQMFEFAGTDININIPINNQYKCDKLTRSFFDRPMATADSLNKKFFSLKEKTADNKASFLNCWNIEPSAEDIFISIKKRIDFMKKRDLKEVSENLDWFLPNLRPKVEIIENPVIFPDSVNLANSRRYRIAEEKKQIEMLKKLSETEIFSEEETEQFIADLHKFALQLKENLPTELNFKKNYLKIAIGSPGNDEYDVLPDLLIETGGNDIYYAPKASENELKIIIDLDGDDFYTGKDSVLSAVLGEIFVLDMAGDDRYFGEDFSVASVFGGTAVILDEDGNDIYKACDFGISSSKRGFSAIIDRNGDDFYNAQSYCQAFASCDGTSYLLDENGNDIYNASSPHEDIIRYEDHQLTMAQGFSIGERPFRKGGTAMLIDFSGNDVYRCDVFGQGAAYWLSSGVLADLDGNDLYSAMQYCQGAGVHLANGYFLDISGDDNYVSHSVSLGCGHDLSFGYFCDANGSDEYSADVLAFGAGNANGFGFFEDKNGDDLYAIRKASRSLGYGNSRREYGSLGIFLDHAGKDHFTYPGFKNKLKIKSRNGVFRDFGDE
ncbi:MAG: hypothetical protein CSB55_01065 [Candidatus Cloacimonadota bacterium]|nr:MAG: hypothetical protein CSB55_01065 [Candidatus Cloacimonadota bacterium]